MNSSPPEPIHRRIVTDEAHRETPFPGDTGNLIFQLPGSASSSTLPRRLLVSHLDTVPVCVGSQPERQGDTIVSADPATGLGADNRAGAATLLTAARAILEHQLPHPPLTFSLDDSGRSRPSWGPAAGSEPTGRPSTCLQLGRRCSPQADHRGDRWIPSPNHDPRQGCACGQRTGNGGQRLGDRGLGDRGPPPARLARSDSARRSAGHQQHWRDLWWGSHQCGHLRGTGAGGGPAATIPSFASGSSRKWKSRFDTQPTKFAIPRANAARWTGKGQLDYESFCLSTDSPCVRIAEQTVRQFAAEPEFAIANGGVDANWLSARGIPTVSMGCGQRHQHMVSESLCVPEYLTACRIALALATDMNP